MCGALTLRWTGVQRGAASGSPWRRGLRRLEGRLPSAVCGAGASRGGAAPANRLVRLSPEGPLWDTSMVRKGVE